jgi:hypothetical protein
VDGTATFARWVTRHWLLLALLGVFVAVSVPYVARATRPVERDGSLTRSAILRWMPQVQGLRDGKDPYLLYNYPNPPVMALFLLPLTELPPAVTALLWFYLKVGMALAALAMTFRLVESSGQPLPGWAKAVTIILVVRFFVTDLQHGNINLYILFLVVSALALLRSGRDVFAGITLALAIACKVTPALFLPYLIWKRAWWSVAGATVGLAFFLFALPGLTFGEQRNLELLGGWYRVMVKPFVLEGKVTPEHQNQSLPGLAVRLLTAAPAFSDYLDDERGVEVYTPLEYHNVADIGPARAALLVKVCLLAFAGFVVWSCRAPFGPAVGSDGRVVTRSDWRLAAEYGLVMAGMLLFSERTWKHHAVTLLVPVAVLAYAVSSLPLRPWLRGWCVGVLALTGVAMLAAQENLAGKHGADLAMVYGAFTAVFALSAGSMVLLLRFGPPAKLAAAADTPLAPRTLPAAA